MTLPPGAYTAIVSGAGGGVGVSVIGVFELDHPEIPLANPSLTLVRQSDQAVIATNDDWQTNANAADITASGFAPTDAHESALLVTLDPGAYTAIVSGVGGGTGVSVVGVFTVP